MNKKHISIITVAAFSVICAMTSCDKNETSKTTVVSNSSETTKENTVSSVKIPEFDDNGSKITSVVVTDENKITVTNAAGLPVTELAVLGNDNKIVTKANGEPVPPALSSAANQQQQQQQASPVGPDLSNPDAPEDYKGFSAFLWMAALSNSNKFIPFSADSEMVQVKIKIKDDAKDGNYELIFNPNGSSYCKDSKDSEDIHFDLANPVITIGNAEAPEAFDVSSTTNPVIYAENASVQPGDEITLSFRLANNPGIIAATTSFNYDNTAMTVEDIIITDALSNGTFQTNIK